MLLKIDFSYTNIYYKMFTLKNIKNKCKVDPSNISMIQS